MKPEEDFRTRGDEKRSLGVPRFDDESARTASPVVPLAEVGRRSPLAGLGAAASRLRDTAAERLHGATGQLRAATARRDFRRSWPLALLLVGVLVAAVAAGSALRYQQATPPEDPAPAAQAADKQRDSAAQTRATETEAATRRREDSSTRDARRDGPNLSPRVAPEQPGVVAGATTFALQNLFGDERDADDRTDDETNAAGERTRRDDWRDRDDDGDRKRSSRGKRRVKAARSGGGGARLVDVIRHD